MELKDNLKQQTISGILWSFFDLMGNQLIRLVIQIILARLLLPEDFGLVGMVTVFISLSTVFIESGFTRGLIRDQKTTEVDYSTIFYFHLGMAIGLYAILYVSAPLLSVYFFQPMLVDVLRVLGLVLIINAFSLIQSTKLVKLINFKVQAQINLVAACFSGVLGIWMAYQGYGVYSLVAKTLLNQAIIAILFALVTRWVPQWVFHMASFKRLFKFGWKLMVASLANNLYDNINYLIIGRAFTLTDLGFYTKARSLKETVAASLTLAIQRVSFPVLSQLQHDNERLKRGYKQILKNSGYIMFPIMIGLAATAPALLPVLLGPQWLDMVPYFQILCLGGMLYPLNAINLNIFQVTGRSDLYLGLDLLRKGIGLSLIFMVLFFRLGIYGLLWAAVASSYISYVLNVLFSQRLLNYRLWEQIKDLLPAYLLSFVMASVVLAIPMVIAPSLLVTLIIQVGVGVLIYIVGSFMLKIEELHTLWNIILSVVDKLRLSKKK